VNNVLTIVYTVVYNVIKELITMKNKVTNIKSSEFFKNLLIKQANDKGMSITEYIEMLVYQDTNKGDNEDEKRDCIG